MRLTARSEYGLLALIDRACRDGDGPVSVRDVAERKEIPQKFLEQLFGALRKSGLVTAVRGARGGFEISRDASTVTVLEIVEALEGPLQPTPCCGDDLCLRSQACAASSVWAQAGAALRQVLGTTTLASLAGAQTVMDSGPGDLPQVAATGR